MIIEACCVGRCHWQEVSEQHGVLALAPRCATLLPWRNTRAKEQPTAVASCTGGTPAVVQAQTVLRLSLSHRRLFIIAVWGTFLPLPFRTFSSAFLAYRSRRGLIIVLRPYPGGSSLRSGAGGVTPVCGLSRLRRLFSGQQ